MNPPDPLRGLRVAVIEDEALVSLLIEGILEDLGCEVVGSAARVVEGVDMVSRLSDEIDAAILDVNLAGETAFPVAEALAERGIRFGFATGYGASLPAPWSDRPTLQKPYILSDIRDLLLELTV